MRVKKLTYEDLSNPQVQKAIIQIGLKFMAEAEHPFPFNRIHFFSRWLKVTKNNTGAFFLAVDDARGVVGVMGAFFAPDPFSGVLTALESFWFVTRSARMTRAGIMLFRAYEQEADARGCQQVIMANLSNLNERGLSEFYERKGYRRSEQVFRKVL